ncbi:MAG: imm11 family protein [Paracoccaceae bacterium]
MNEPGSFGEFFLDGDYVGWDEALTKAFNETISQEEKDQYNLLAVSSYAFNVVQRFNNITQHEIDHPRAMKPLRDFELPTKFAIKFENSKEFGSLIELTDRLLAVDEPLRAVIEDLEPGVHQFWPIEIAQADGSVLPKQYYGMRIRQYKDSFLPEQSAPASFTDEGSGCHVFSFTLKHCKALKVSSEAIGGAHLWKERKLRSPRVFLSDTLVERIRDAGLRIPNVHQLTEV